MSPRLASFLVSWAIHVDYALSLVETFGDILTLNPSGALANPHRHDVKGNIYEGYRQKVQIVAQRRSP